MRTQVRGVGWLTRFAGLVFNFSKIFCDSVLDAMAAIFADVRRARFIYAVLSRLRGREKGGRGLLSEL